MKWYFWVLIGIVIIVISYLIYKNQTNNKRLSGNIICNNYDETIYQNYGIPMPGKTPPWIARKGCGSFFKPGKCVQGQECNEEITESEYNQIKNTNNLIQ